MDHMAKQRSEETDPKAGVTMSGCRGEGSRNALSGFAREGLIVFGEAFRSAYSASSEAWRLGGWEGLRCRAEGWCSGLALTPLFVPCASGGAGWGLPEEADIPDATGNVRTGGLVRGPAALPFGGARPSNPIFNCDFPPGLQPCPIGSCPTALCGGFGKCGWCLSGIHRPSNGGRQWRETCGQDGGRSGHRGRERR